MQRLVDRGELDKQGAGFAMTSRPTFEVAQQRRLVSAAKENFRIAGVQAAGDRGQAQLGVLCVHQFNFRLEDSAGQRWEATPEPAL